MVGPPSTRPAYPIASVDNALRLLTMLRGGEAITLTAASERLGVARSTAHRLLAMLRYHGFVTQDPVTRSYGPGSALVELALSIAGGQDVRALARAELQQLVDEIDETAHLDTLVGADALVLESVECRQVLRVTSRAGVAMPAHVTAAGKVLLAQLGDDELHSRTDRTDVLEELASVRVRGYATNFGESEPGLAVIAVALPRLVDAPALAVSISAPADRVGPERVEELAAAATRAARRMAGRLGAGPTRGAGTAAP